MFAIETAVPRVQTKASTVQFAIRRKYSGVSAPGMLSVRRTPSINSSPVCAYKRMISLRA
jgi:hypothetical protein